MCVCVETVWFRLSDTKDDDVDCMFVTSELIDWNVGNLIYNLKPNTLVSGSFSFSHRFFCLIYHLFPLMPHTSCLHVRLIVIDSVLAFSIDPIIVYIVFSDFYFSGRTHSLVLAAFVYVCE